MKWYGIIEPGDLLVTRNSDEVGNASPGYWNHVSMYVGGGPVRGGVGRQDRIIPCIVVEAQVEPGKVIESEWGEFYERYPKIVLLRLHAISRDRQKALALAAHKMVGKPYSRWASLTKIFRRHRTQGENCVSVNRRIYKNETGFDFGWRRPDDVIEDTHFRRVIEKGL